MLFTKRCTRRLNKQFIHISVKDRSKTGRRNREKNESHLIFLYSVERQGKTSAQQVVGEETSIHIFLTILCRRVEGGEPSVYTIIV